MPRRKFDARPDSADFRDRTYVPTLVEVQPEYALSDYRSWGVPVLDQGTDGACTGYGLATVVHYLHRTLDDQPSSLRISPWMMYSMAKRYDDWAGTGYEGSSPRGAMKGWHKHGVCRKSLWGAEDHRRLTAERSEDAAKRPLGAYYRVNHQDLVAMHAAISETGILYGSALVHAGWEDVDRSGLIRHKRRMLGGHAFAIVAYDEEGFWIQNSWGRSWGMSGFGRIAYDDWLENGTDVWVARLGVPIVFGDTSRSAKGRALVARQPAGYSYNELRPHIVMIGNDGTFHDRGTYGTNAEEVKEVVMTELPKITKDWKKKRILLFAHGGLVGEKGAIDRVAGSRQALLNAEVYPLAFIWRSDYWTTLKNMLSDAFRRRRSEGIIDDSKDFMLDRLDDALEPVARHFSGKAQWDEMKENALAASADGGGARFVVDRLSQLVAGGNFEIHVAGHSAGAIFQAPLVTNLVNAGIPIKTCTLWAPACTVDLFKSEYLPAVQSKAIEKLALYTLTDDAEQDDHCGHIYNKSLLYLVSNAFEKEARNPLPFFGRDGWPILGMEKFVSKDKDLQKLFGKTGKTKAAEWIKAPNREAKGTQGASKAKGHGAFDDDPHSVIGTLARILGKASVKAEFAFERSESSRRERRGVLDGV